MFISSAAQSSDVPTMFDRLQSLAATESRSTVYYWFWRTIVALVAISPLILIWLEPRVFATDNLGSLGVQPPTRNLQLGLTRLSMYILIFVCFLAVLAGLARGVRI